MTKNNLFEVLTIAAHCAYESDLKHLSSTQTLQLAIFLEIYTTPSDYPLNQWNDALNYILSFPACSNSLDARQMLIKILKNKSHT